MARRMERWWILWSGHIHPF